MVCMGLKDAEDVEELAKLQPPGGPNNRPQLGHYLFGDGPDAKDVRLAVFMAQTYGPRCGVGRLYALIAMVALAMVTEDSNRQGPRRFSSRHIIMFATCVTTLFPSLGLLLIGLLHRRLDLLWTSPEMTIGAAGTLAVSLAVLHGEVYAGATSLRSPSEFPRLGHEIIWAVVLVAILAFLPIRYCQGAEHVTPEAVVFCIVGWVAIAVTICLIFRAFKYFETNY